MKVSLHGRDHNINKSHPETSQRWSSHSCYNLAAPIFSIVIINYLLCWRADELYFNFNVLGGRSPADQHNKETLNLYIGLDTLQYLWKKRSQNENGTHVCKEP